MLKKKMNCLTYISNTVEVRLIDNIRQDLYLDFYLTFSFNIISLMGPEKEYI